MCCVENRQQKDRNWKWTKILRTDSVWCAKIAPKLKNIRKSLRKQGFFDIFSSSLCLLGAILAEKENNFICKKKCDVWHPWDSWGRVNSGRIFFFWVQTATVFTVCHHFNFRPSLILADAQIAFVHLTIWDMPLLSRNTWN